MPFPSRLEDREDQIREMIGAGWSQKRMSTELGITQPALCYFLKVKQIQHTGPRKKSSAPKKTRVRRDRPTWKWGNRCDTEWHVPAREMYESGSSIRSIAELFHRNHKTVRRVVGAEGLHRERIRLWHDEACAMYERGVSAEAIADKFQKNIAYVLEVLTSRGLRKCTKQVNTITKRSIVAASLFSEDRPRELRKPKQILNRDAVMDAAKAFASGAITRSELMERISA